MLHPYFPIAATSLDTTPNSSVPKVAVVERATVQNCFHQIRIMCKIWILASKGYWNPQRKLGEP